MGAGARAKRTLLGIEIPRDELALQIAIGAIGMTPPVGVRASKVLDDMNQLAVMDPGCPRMGEGFRLAADRAVAYFHAQINAAKEPN